MFDVRLGGGLAAENSDIEKLYFLVSPLANCEQIRHP